MSSTFSTYISSEISDDSFSSRFQSNSFFWNLNTFFLWSLLAIHLVHWFINLFLEYKNTRSCGTSERKEGVVGYLLLGFGVVAVAATSFWLIYAYPSWSGIGFGPGHNGWWIPIAWIGTFLSIIVTILFAYVHYSLGLSWSGTVTVKTDHKLVTDGPYRFARHPMYAVLLPVPLVTFMQTSNWLYALSFVVALCYPVSRCRKEERLMQTLFGDEYRDYMDAVGAFCPFTFRWWGNRQFDEQAYSGLVNESDFTMDGDEFTL